MRTAQNASDGRLLTTYFQEFHGARYRTSRSPCGAGKAATYSSGRKTFVKRTTTASRERPIEGASDAADELLRSFYRVVCGLKRGDNLMLRSW